MTTAGRWFVQTAAIIMAMTFAAMHYIYKTNVFIVSVR